MNWIIAIIVTIIYLCLMVFRKEKKSGGYISLDLNFAFEQILITMAYLIFWIIWLIVNQYKTNRIMNKKYFKELTYFLISLIVGLILGITTTWYIGLFCTILCYSFPIRQINITSGYYLKIKL